MHVELIDARQIVVFEVSEFPIKPASYKNRYYKRVHNSNQRYGTGFIRVREALTAYPELRLDIAELGDYFIASLRGTPPITPPISAEGGLPLTPLEQKILQCVIANPALSSTNIAAQTGMGRDTVKEYLARLKKKGIIHREGSLRAGIWRVTEAGRKAAEENAP